MSSREEITQKYLFKALKELSKHRGCIKEGRNIEKAYKEEIIAFEEDKNKPKTKIKLNIK